MIYIVLIFSTTYPEDCCTMSTHWNRVHPRYFTTAASAEAWITKHKKEWPHTGYEYEVKPLEKA